MGKFGFAAISLLALTALTPATYADIFGDPPVAEFTPTLDVYPQNFAIVQDTSSVVYIGNSEGVLTFDGERWTLIPLPNHYLVRSLATDGHGRVYVGGYNIFGYLERDAAGTLSFHDLTPLFAKRLKGESFADIWRIAVTPQGVFFQAVQHLFQYVPKTGQTRMWRHAGRFGTVQQHGNALLAQFRGVGLQRLLNGAWQPVPGGDVFKDLVFRFLSLPNGGLLGMARDGRWRALQNGEVREYAMPAGFPASNAFSAWLTLADGSFVLGAKDGALYFFRPGGDRFRRFQLATDSISGIVAANDGGLLAVTNEGFYRIAWPTRWTMLGRAHGLRGDLYRAARWGNRWFALTGAGVYEAVPIDDGAAQRFKRRNWTGHEAWDLLGLDATRALLADSYRLLLLEGDAAKPLSSATFYPRLLHRSRFDPAIVYVGTELGFGVARQEHGRWQLVLEQNNMHNLTVNSLAETGPGELWLGSERGGIWRVRLSADHTRVLGKRHMDQANGIDYGIKKRARVAWLPGNGLLVSTAAGLYRRQAGRFEPTTLSGLGNLRSENEILQLVAGREGELWAFSERRLYHRPTGEAWRRVDLSGFGHSALQSLSFEASGAAVVATTRVVLRYASNASAGIGFSAPRVALSSVEYVDLTNGARHNLSLRRDAKFRFTQGDFGIAFHFALPDYRRVGAVRYQVRLVPYESNFSGWSASGGYTYSRLSTGTYRFELRGRDSAGRITEAIPFEFTILPHWYTAGWAWTLWIVLVLLLLASLTQWLVRLRTRHLTLETTRLEDMVRQRTRALESANRLLNSIAHLDSLTEIPNRRRLDAYLIKAWGQCANQAHSMAVLLIDVDHFKIYNDQHGHLAGDELLKQLAGVLSGCLRRGDDLVARYGGEEFLVVLPGADAETARALGETMRYSVESSLDATISVGVAAHQPRSGERVSILISAADAALYQAKTAGRNRVVVG
ncbi:MAG TPA: GGDEF domain-containing protein [Gammaproteobacteria bacterium]|nr:GGDEF domain-containing protein [Gammaproteobacteria bacterium]